MTALLPDFDAEVPSAPARGFRHAYGVPFWARHPGSRALSALSSTDDLSRRDRRDRPARRDRTTALTRYVGGTYSPTVQLLRFTGGREARTDLIRLNPGGRAYSVDVNGRAPSSVSHYRDADRSESPIDAPAQRQVSRLVGRSYPVVGLRELSARVRDAGYPLGSADLAAHDAIAATQAAIWQVTNGVDLDTQGAWLPCAAAVIDGVGVGGVRVHLDPAHPRWRGQVRRDRPVAIDFTFGHRPQLGSFTVVLNARSDVSALAWSLERSTDGRHWVSVPTSATSGSQGTADGVVSPIDSRVTITTRLGVGTTWANGSGAGYPRYRLVMTTQAVAARVLLDDVRFTVLGAEGYRNPEPVVHLYTYLLTEALEQIGAPSPGPDAPMRLLVGSSSRQGPATFTPVILAEEAPVTETQKPHRDNRRPPLSVVPGSTVSGQLCSHGTRPTQLT